MERTRNDKCTEALTLRYLATILQFWSRAEEYGKKNDGGYLTPSLRLRIGKGVKRVLINKEEKIREEAPTAFKRFRKEFLESHDWIVAGDNRENSGGTSNGGCSSLGTQ